MLKHVPVQLRRLLAQRLARAQALVVWLDDVSVWCELEMLGECILCAPPRSGNARENQRLAVARFWLNRWLAGERVSLRRNMPNYLVFSHERKNSLEADMFSKQKRRVELCRKGAYAKSSQALTKPPPPPVAHTAAVAAELAGKHPRSQAPLDFSHLGPTNAVLVRDLG